MEEWSIGNQIYDVPFYQVHRVHLWGTTAMITVERLRFHQAITPKVN